MSAAPPIRPEEARRALHDLSRVETRTSEWLFGRQASPHLILWGLIWAIGYGAEAVRPDLPSLWIILVPVGVIASLIIGFLLGRGHDAGSGRGYLIGLALVMVFAASCLAVLQPATAAQISAFPPLLVGLIYGLMGLAPGGRRLLFLGAAITGLTLVGYFRFQDWFSAWMALVGGGGLVLGGVWMRRA
jgi:hypothetical protein